MYKSNNSIGCETGSGDALHVKRRDAANQGEIIREEGKGRWRTSMDHGSGTGAGAGEICLFVFFSLPQCMGEDGWLR